MYAVHGGARLGHHGAGHQGHKVVSLYVMNIAV